MNVAERSQDDATSQFVAIDRDIESSLERFATALTGLGLIVSGVRRGSAGGMLIAAGGGGLVYRAVASDGSHRGETGQPGSVTGPVGRHDGSALPFEIRRTMTIGKGAEELYQLWREPRTIEAIMKDSFDVVVNGDVARWRLSLPAGQSVEWRTTITEDQPGKLIRWRSNADTALPNRGSVAFRPAPMNLGTEVTLEFAFDPPRGIIGDAAMKVVDALPVVSQWLPSYLAGKPLHRFKSLAETGEIPTTEGQPAARADTE